MEQECIRCHKIKDIQLFKPRNKTCKLCKWFEKHKFVIPKDWNESDVKYIIEQIHDNHTCYIDEIAKDINKSIDDIVKLLRDELKLSNIRNQKIRIKIECAYCGNPTETFMCKYQVNNFNFCSHDCYSKYRSIYYVGDKASVYTKVLCKCDNCGKELLIPKNKINAVNSEGVSHNFCNHFCYSEFRKKYYTGDKLYNNGIHLSDEQKEQCRINTTRCYSEGKFTRLTKPQVIVNNLLDELGIRFRNEENFKYYSIDNFLVDYNLIIEVMGDYFHSNPLKYKYENLNEMQIKDKVRDKRKHTYILKYYGIEMLYLWESDINNNPEKCKKLISEYILNSGYLLDYNSYNYDFNGKELRLKENITNPYFI